MTGEQEKKNVIWSRIVTITKDESKRYDENYTRFLSRITHCLLHSSSWYNAVAAMSILYPQKYFMFRKNANVNISKPKSNVSYTYIHDTCHLFNTVSITGKSHL